jgi:hypothetical protein
MSLICQTQWHGNPRPVTSYHITVTDPVQGDFRHFTSLDEYSVAGAAVTTTNVGVRAAFAEIEFSGVFKEGTNLSLNWITYDDQGAEIATRGAAGAIPYDCSATQAANLFAQFINGNVDTQAAQAAGVMKIYPVGIAAEINCGQIVVS